MADLNELALQFTRGAWASPLVCEHEGKAQRGLRRLMVTKASANVLPPSNKLVFYPMQVPPEIRCYADTGEAQPDVSGSLIFHREGFSRPDLASREFQEVLERDGGFSFEIRAGTLRVAERKVDFRDGKACFALVRPGSDAARRLGDLEGRRKLTLTLEASDGTRLAFDLAQAGPGR